MKTKDFHWDQFRFLDGCVTINPLNHCSEMDSFLVQTSFIIIFLNLFLKINIVEQNEQNEKKVETIEWTILIWELWNVKYLYKINYENWAAVINYELLFFYINCAIKNVDFINFIIVMTLKHWWTVIKKLISTM